MFKGRFFQTIKKLKLAEKQYKEEKAKRVELEAKLELALLSPLELAYIEDLVLFDQVLNSHSHSEKGLYTKLNEKHLDLTEGLLFKMKKMKEVKK